MTEQEKVAMTKAELQAFTKRYERLRSERGEWIVVGNDYYTEAAEFDTLDDAREYARKWVNRGGSDVCIAKIAERVELKRTARRRH